MMIFTPFAGGSLTTTPGMGEFVMASGEDGSTPPVVIGTGGNIGLTVSTVRLGL